MSGRQLAAALLSSAAAGALAGTASLLIREGHEAATGAATLAVAAGALLVVASMLTVRRPLRTRADTLPDEALFAAFPEPALIVEGNRVAVVNRRLCELLGADREALVGMTPPYDFWPPEHRHELERWHDLLATQGAVEAELTLRRADGQRFPVLASGSSVPTTGALPRFAISVRDITERRRVEDRLAALASRDPLTELLNEWGFQERLSEEVARARATGRTLSIVLVQFDGLATQGDLAAAIARFRGDLRAGEQISRTNETELAWILPEVDAAGAIAAVTRAVGHVRKLAGDVIGSVRVSAGICELGVGHDAAVLYALADRALKAAASQGGGTVVYSPDSTHSAP
ncbi:MAG: PAS domain S-box protein [Gaiellales bacterium]